MLLETAVEKAYQETRESFANSNPLPKSNFVAQRLCNAMTEKGIHAYPGQKPDGDFVTIYVDTKKKKWMIDLYRDITENRPFSPEDLLYDD